MKGGFPGFARALALSCVLGIASVATGCALAKPKPSERQGFLERVAAADHSRQSKSLSRATRKPASPQEWRDRKAAVEVSMGQLRWPLKSVEVTSPYGKRGNDFHEGIDLRAKSGTPVYAAQEGTVIYAGNKIRGYGKLVVIRHFRELSTVYAHNSKLLVRTGQFVRVGQKIAVSGNTGHSSGPHLHFEVRDGLSALDPNDLLADAEAASAGPDSAPPRADLAELKEVKGAGGAKEEVPTAPLASARRAGGEGDDTASAGGSVGSATDDKVKAKKARRQSRHARDHARAQASAAPQGKGKAHALASAKVHGKARGKGKARVDARVAAHHSKSKSKSKRRLVASASKGARVATTEQN